MALKIRLHEAYNDTMDATDIQDYIRGILREYVSHNVAQSVLDKYASADNLNKYGVPRTIEADKKYLLDEYAAKIVVDCAKDYILEDAKSRGVDASIDGLVVTLSKDGVSQDYYIVDADTLAKNICEGYAVYDEEHPKDLLRGLFIDEVVDDLLEYIEWSSKNLWTSLGFGK